jgi:2-polyprenyl-3-methyl-5-hydroxy-6-metoxy-1,4-benzoquinol methylase
MGVNGYELSRQINKLLHMAEAKCKPMPLLTTETKLWRGMYSKSYYETGDENLISMISQKSRNVLSIGCGWGESECRLAEKGLRVVALPLDPVICSRAAARGVEMVFGDFRTAKSKLEAEKFDCILYLNVLHLIRDPIEVLALFRDNLSSRSVVVIQTPNMLSVPAMRSSTRLVSRLQGLAHYDLFGVHFTFVRKVCNWCHSSGLRVDSMRGVFRGRSEMFPRLIPGFISLPMAPEFITVARKR